MIRSSKSRLAFSATIGLVEERDAAPSPRHPPSASRSPGSHDTLEFQIPSPGCLSPPSTTPRFCQLSGPALMLTSLWETEKVSSAGHWAPTGKRSQDPTWEWVLRLVRLAQAHSRASSHPNGCAGAGRVGVRRRKGQPGGRPRHAVPPPRGRASLGRAAGDGPRCPSIYLSPPTRAGKALAISKRLGWGAKRINQGNAQKCSLLKNLQIIAGRCTCQGPRGGSGEGTRRLFSFPASPPAGSAGSQAPRLSFTCLPLQTNTPKIKTKAGSGQN